MGALSVIWSPVAALSRVAEERRVLSGFAVTALYAALSLVATAVAFFGGLAEAQLGAGGAPVPPEVQDLLVPFSIVALLFAAVWPFVFWLLVSGLMHLVTRFFGGTGPFSATLAAVGVAGVPFVVYAALGLPLSGLQVVLGPESAAGAILGLLSSLLGLAALLWFAALVVVGVALARRVGYGESAGSCAISCAGCAGLILLVGVVLAVLVALVAGAAGSAGGP
ncbi:hypothetical protein GBA65_19815 [Rubrobacter marinus]|uniref:Yip1 domain-containing protein n=1 Tax=Rubrobacter marinus TaxID=2653852 RepID=A0A6G8Q1P1_9ACTN|nr:YIP1 family protein [Rubrobacter marinus]QIN80389.1 hypothetical protein GBA65_19815 [Rubrobacter marinus]